jgi:hypothetical protein
MDKNFECELHDTEASTIKQCSNIKIHKIIDKELGRGTYGVIYPVIVQFGSQDITLILKKISKTFNKKKEQDNFIKDMYDEVDYSYEMGKNKIGPRVYDAFFYQNGDLVNQYILMEKFDTSVANWILSNNSKLSSTNCAFVGIKMLDLLHKQIFIMNTYCGDIKTDNFVINFDPLVVKMIDFGIDWCSTLKLPKIYSKVKSISNHSNQIRKEIFYCMCTLQLFMNVLNVGTPLSIAKLILKPFYNDDIFIKYVLENSTKTQLRFEESKIRSRSNVIDFRIILKDVLDYGHDQAILLSHYLKGSDNMNTKEIVDYVFDRIKQMSKLIFKRD